MNMIRKLFSIMLVAAMLTAMATTARAMSPLQSDIQPRYVGVSTASANLTISSSGKATVSSRVCTSPGYTVNVVVSLERDSGASVKSWSNSGGGNVIVDEIYYVSHNGWSAGLRSPSPAPGRGFQMYACCPGSRPGRCGTLPSG